MLLHLDEFDDSNVLELHFEPSTAEARELLDGIEFTPEEALVVDLTAVRSGSAVRLLGTLRGTFSFACGRCLSEREHEFDESVEFVVLSKAAWEATYEGENEIELDADDLDVSFYEGDTIDLRPLVREAIILELPNYPRCPEELREACDEAYEAYVGGEVLDEQEENSVDLRWGPLKELKKKMEAESDD
jgi:uncharacterized protein